MSRWCSISTFCVALPLNISPLHHIDVSRGITLTYLHHTHISRGNMMQTFVIRRLLRPSSLELFSPLFSWMIFAPLLSHLSTDAFYAPFCAKMSIVTQWHSSVISNDRGMPLDTQVSFSDDGVSQNSLMWETIISVKGSPHMSVKGSLPWEDTHDNWDKTLMILESWVSRGRCTWEYLRRYNLNTLPFFFFFGKTPRPNGKVHKKAQIQFR